MRYNSPSLQVIAAVVASSCFAVLSPCAYAGAVTVDLGLAPAGTVDDFEVEARNQSCDEPQSFRFAPRGLAWLKLVNGGTLRNVERGKAKIFTARIDLTGMKPGRYAGTLDVICETCGDFAGSRCHIDRESIEIKVEIVARASRFEGPGRVEVRAQAE